MCKNGSPYTRFCRLSGSGYLCSMEVNDALIEKLSQLSKLRFSDKEKEDIKNDLQRMIQFVEKLNELNLEGISPITYMGDAVSVLREDEVEKSIDRAAGLQNAPLHDETFFKVPKVLNP